MHPVLNDIPIGDLDSLSKWIDIHGGDNDDLPAVVQRMKDSDLTWKDIAPYRLVCSCPIAVRECLDNDITPVMLEIPLDGKPLGIMVSANDITAPEARQLWEDSL